MTETERIVIIEGPPPTFEYLNDAWLLGLTEGPIPGRIARTRLRTFNGPALVERCHRAWRKSMPIHLEFRGSEDLTERAPIVAVRWVEAREGDMLDLWVQLEEEDLEFELDYEVDEFEDEAGDELGDGYDDGFDEADLDFTP